MNSSLYSVPQIPLSSTSLKERLKGLARELLEKDPLKMEKTARRVRVLFDNTYLADSTSAYHVWEHEYYPQFYFRTSELQVNYVGREQIGNDDAVSFATYKGLTRSDGTALMFKKGKLAGLTRFEFGQMDAWFEEDQPIYQHPKDPYKRIDILPSTRNVSVKFKNVVIAESNMNMFLFETMLKTRHYMPKTAVNWQYMKPSLKTTICPYKGVAEYYSLRIDGLEIKDAAWWYRNPTLHYKPKANGHHGYAARPAPCALSGLAWKICNSTSSDHAIPVTLGRQIKATLKISDKRWPSYFTAVPLGPRTRELLAIELICYHQRMMEPVAKAAITGARQAIRSLPLPTRLTPTISRGRSRHLSFSPRAQHSLHSRRLHQGITAKAQAAVAEATQQSPEPPSGPTNPALAFPCLDAREAKTASLVNRSLSSGPEPSYNAGQHLTWNCQQPLLLDWGGLLPEYNIAYETWGQLDAQKSNAILLHTGLSASSHAHSTPANPKPGWWEKFIGPGAPLDTDKYFVICTNVIGSCYGSTGPQSIDPANGEHYATRFPILTMQDMVRAQFRLLDAFGINRLYASLGSSMGGMQSLAAGVLFPERVGRIVSISGCARSHPYSIAMRHTQRQVLMMDPNWSRGFYYDGIPPHTGMKLAREIATVTYRSGPEWEQRFGRRRADPARPPALCPDFLIETYLDHAGEKFCLEYDANSLLYVSKAMDLFDLGRDHQEQMRHRRRQNESALAYKGASPQQDQTCSLVLPETPYEEQPSQTSSKSLSDPVESTSHRPPADLVAGLSSLRGHPTLVMGVASDNLFPAWQQREVAETLRAAGNRSVTHVELGEDTSLFGHDTFLLDLKHIGGSIRTFLG